MREDSRKEGGRREWGGRKFQRRGKSSCLVQRMGINVEKTRQALELVGVQCSASFTVLRCRWPLITMLSLITRNKAKLNKLKLVVNQHC